MVEETLNLIANALVVSNLDGEYGVKLPGATKNMGDALGLLHKSVQLISNGMLSETFVWSTGRDQFVENFTRLVMGSQMQVGTGTHLSYADVSSFIQNFVDKDGK